MYFMNKCFCLLFRYQRWTMAGMCIHIQEINSLLWDPEVPHHINSLQDPIPSKLNLVHIFTTYFPVVNFNITLLSIFQFLICSFSVKFTFKLLYILIVSFHLKISSVQDSKLSFLMPALFPVCDLHNHCVCNCLFTNDISCMIYRYVSDIFIPNFKCLDLVICQLLLSNWKLKKICV